VQGTAFLYPAASDPYFDLLALLQIPCGIGSGEAGGRSFDRLDPRKQFGSIFGDISV